MPQIRSRLTPWTEQVFAFVAQAFVISELCDQRGVDTSHGATHSEGNAKRRSARKFRTRRIMSDFQNPVIFQSHFNRENQPLRAADMFRAVRKTDTINRKAPAGRSRMPTLGSPA
jgi:hypothetical protein